jgi:splicing factor 3B subunit 3
MFMYSLTIQPPTAVTQAILGQFAGTKEQQIVTASGSRLTIHRPDPTQGKITPIYSQDVFGIIRSLAAFRLAGSNKGMFDILSSSPQSQDQLSDSSSFPGNTILICRADLIGSGTCSGRRC